MQERDLLAAAQGGDEDAYRRLVDPYRRELHAHCYRMLASVHDAEDALQDALLRAWRGLATYRGRGTIRSWLFRIATNACLDLIARRPPRALPVEHGPAAAVHDTPGEPPVESVWIEPYPDAQIGIEDEAAAPAARYERRESLELAFVAALQHLPARQRAVLILREVLGFSAREAAEALDATVASVNSALQRARRTLDERLPERTQQATLRALGEERMRELVQRYADALERADIDAIVELLTDDPTWSMPPLPYWYHGREAVVAFLREGPFTVRWRHLPTSANGQLAVGCYVWDEERQAYVAEVIDVLTLRGERIEAVTAFIDPDLFPRFGLPDQLV